MNIFLIIILIIVIILSALSSIFSIYILYKIRIKEKIITKPKIIKRKSQKVHIFKWNGTYWERFLENLKKW